MTVLVLVLALVMSSLDTLLNGIASVFTTDIAADVSRYAIHRAFCASVGCSPWWWAFPAI
jgi:Na+/proline symporter